MASLSEGWRIQTRVIHALMLRELTTRFGRENIGFLWVMAEPLLFAVLVGIMWTLLRGNSEYGISVMAFSISGYIPVVLFRHAINRSVGLFVANGSLMYHRQINIFDFVFVRFIVEFIGHIMTYVFVATLLWLLNIFPTPYHIGYIIMGWMFWSFFTLSVCFVLAPLSAMSEVVEKFIAVVTYIMVPLSGAFHLLSWTTPRVRDALLYSPLVHGMEMMRFGIFGHSMTPYFSYFYPLAVSSLCMVIGLFLCRRLRRTLVVE